MVPVTPRNPPPLSFGMDLLVPFSYELGLGWYWLLVAGKGAIPFV